MKNSKSQLDELRDIIALDKYGKTYKALPDDGAQQDYVAGEADRRMKLTCTPAVAAVGPVRGELDGGGTFTPGPWTACRDERNKLDRFLLGSPQGNFGHFQGWASDGITTEAEDEANARLIAAAPEMREVLRLLIAHPRWEQVAKLITTSNDRTTNFGVLIPAILAKARGQ